MKPAYQNTGIGEKLLQTTIELAREKRYREIVIFGKPGYYPKHGFLTCNHFEITTSTVKNFDAFCGYEIVPGAFSEVKGQFHESKIFEELSPELVVLYDSNFPYMEKLRLNGQWQK